MKATYDLEKLTDLVGPVKELVTPSGFKVVIREQNGEDDATISNAKDVRDGTATNKFIRDIVVATTLTSNGRLNLDNVREMKLCDKYFILIASRIFSLGQVVKFDYVWLYEDDGVKKELEVAYEEDLGLYIWDYSKPFPLDKCDEDYYKFRIKPHPHGLDTLRVLEVSPGKRVRYHYIDGIGERYQMLLTEEANSVNSEILARRLELEGPDGKWVQVKNFKGFNSNEMRSIRKDIEENDNILSVFSEIENPKNGMVINYPILGTPDFFFPREI